jgi:putative addiction module component (TIGR02574 family)
LTASRSEEGTVETAKRVQWAWRSDALSRDVHHRAALAQGLLASLEELSEEESERLWAEEAHRRLEEYRAGRAKAVRAEEVVKKAEALFR